MRISTVAEMREMDTRAMREHGIPVELLMENAGLAASALLVRLAREAWGSIRGRGVAVVCGIGNNGGDGLVVARHLHSAGAAVRLLVVGDPAGYRGPAKLNYEIALKLRLPMAAARGAASLREALAGAHVVVDALFGTGLSREPEGIHREAVLAMNAAAGAGALVVSLDIPSGVHGDSGAIMGEAVRAAHTVTFGLPKIGSLLYPGFACSGKLWLSYISFPPELYEREDLRTLVNDPPALPPRAPDGHKGSFGDALFVAGSRSYLGAPTLASLSHLKAGGGYARLALPASLVPALAASAREVVFLPQPDSGPESASGEIAASALPDLLGVAERSDFVVVGPGLSLGAGAGEVALGLIRKVRRPVLVDGDGLTHLARSPEAAEERQGPLVLTPHPGELARLLGTSVEEVTARRVECLREAVSRFRAIVVAKGAHTLIGLPDGRLYVNLSGSSGMATPGSGDVLCGAITAMAGLGLPLEDAVRTGAFVHGLAGDIAARELGEDGVTASDIQGRLPAAVRQLREKREELLRDCYGKIVLL